MGFGAILAGVGAAGQVAGGLIGARAQDRAAAASQRAFAPTAEELELRKSLFAAEGRDVSRREAEIVELSRAMTLAGQNLGDILSGKEASSLGPLRGQIDRDRAQLRQRLRERLGSGFETSTAGSQALNEFDRQAELALTQAQQAQTGLLGQIAQGNRRGITNPNLPNLFQSSLSQRSQAADIAALGEAGNLSRAQTLGSLGQSAFSAGTLSSIFGGAGGAAGDNFDLKFDPTGDVNSTAATFDGGSRIGRGNTLAGFRPGTGRAVR